MVSWSFVRGSTRFDSFFFPLSFFGHLNSFDPTPSWPPLPESLSSSPRKLPFSYATSSQNFVRNWFSLLSPSKSLSSSEFAIHGFDSVVATSNKLLNVAKVHLRGVLTALTPVADTFQIHEVPVIVTEQNPRGPSVANLP